MKGVSIGQTTVSAVVVDKDGRKVTSAPQQIEVYFFFLCVCEFLKCHILILAYSAYFNFFCLFLF